MSDTSGTGTSTSEEPDGIKALREAAERGTQATRDKERLERELAFYKAGLTPELLATPLGEMFVKSYDGDLTSDAIKLAASSVNLLKVEGNAGDTPLTDEERAEGMLRDQLGSGRPAGGERTEGPPPHDLALKAYHDAIASGMPEQEARYQYAAAMINATAVEGDTRGYHDQAEFEAKARALLGQ